MTQYGISSDDSLNPALRKEVQNLRGGILGAAASVPLPSRFVAVPNGDQPGVTITDTMTKRSVTVPLYAYSAVREALTGLFGEKSLALRIAEKYYEQHPEELKHANNPDYKPDWVDLERIFGNWLEKCRKTPDKALAVDPDGWSGKVTRAFFAVFDKKTPRLKTDMVKLAVEVLTPTSESN